MKRIFEFIYPDHGGYTFFSIVVWEGPLELADPQTNIGWHSYFRLLEARLVLRGVLLQHVVEASEIDQSTWDAPLKKAEELKSEWAKIWKVPSVPIGA